MATAAAVKAGATARTVQPSLLDALLCPSIKSFADALRISRAGAQPRDVANVPDERIVSLDVKNQHVSISISDSRNRTAVPFGIYSTSTKPHVDAKLLSSAFANIGDEICVNGLVLNVPPSTSTSPSALVYTRELLMPDFSPFQSLQAVLLFSEAHALRHTVARYIDFKNAVTQMPRKSMESKRRSRFDTAMFPNLDKNDLVNDKAAINRISASEVLQAVLDQMALLDRDP